MPAIKKTKSKKVSVGGHLVRALMKLRHQFEKIEGLIADGHYAAAESAAQDGPEMIRDEWPVIQRAAQAVDKVLKHNL